MMRPGEVRVVATSSSRAVEGCPFQRGLGYGWGGRTVRSPPAPLARSSAAVPRPSLGYPSAIPRLSLGSLSAISALAMLRVGLHAPVGGEDARAAVPLQVHAASPTQWEGAARGGLLFALSTLACLLRAGGVV